jgi:hypothetical protein
MSYIDEFTPYKDQYGMYQLQRDGAVGIPTQNGQLFTMEQLIVILEDPTLSDWRRSAELDRLRKVYDSLEPLPGLSRRTPDSLEGNSMDNNGAHLVFSGVFDEGKFAKRMVDQGEKVVCDGIDLYQDPETNIKYFRLAQLITVFQVWDRPTMWWSWAKSGFKPKFFWNNTRPTEFSIWGWYGRSFGFLGEMDRAAGRHTSMVRWFGILIGQFLGHYADLGNMDARKLPYVGWYYLVKASPWYERWFWKLMYRWWVAILLQDFPDGMRDVYARYYGDVNHPIRKYSPRYFGEKQ